MFLAELVGRSCRERHPRREDSCASAFPNAGYGEIAPKVRDVCKRYGLPYNTGPFSRQWWSVQRTILRLAFPGGKPRPKPGPYEGRDTAPAPAATNGDSHSTNGGAPTSESNGKPAPTEHAEADKAD